MKTLLSFASLGFVLGCAPSLKTTVVPAPSHVSGLARVTVSRPGGIFGSALTPVVFDATRKVWLGALPPSSEVSFELPPGKYLLCAPTPRLGVTREAPIDWLASGVPAPVTRLEVEADRRYVLELRVGNGRVELRPALDVEPRSPVSTDLSAPEVAVLHAEAARWAEWCRASSGEDVRLAVSAADGSQL